ncbi:regulatory protein RecX [Sodalis sp. dw_96]|uniref:regulatory protein RecX n=1 Tax=Sodalis sp. dw_96 TaxID=2719794 RepID=UPI001BD5F01B|nr:regulatory protein RecX [Sodalis sp. dw_96]
MTALLDRALHILSLRDHSEAELRRKLAMPSAEGRRWNRRPPAVEVCSNDLQHGVEDDAAEISQAELEAAIEYCRQNDWLNDSRFALRYVNSRSKKGYGEQKIRMELIQKGIDRDTINNAFTEAAIDRSAQAKEVAWKKFGQPLSTDRLVKIKVQRYLLTRGFSFEEIQSIYTQ